MKKILVAEDNDSNFLLMSYILKKKYELIRAENGREAINVIESEPVDLILMDLKMPVMDGLEATRRIKATHPQLPIIALTANAFETDRKTAIAASCDDFLPKPVSATDCLAAIARLLGES